MKTKTTIFIVLVGFLLFTTTASAMIQTHTAVHAPMGTTTMKYTFNGNTVFLQTDKPMKFNAETDGSICKYRVDIDDVNIAENIVDTEEYNVDIDEKETTEHDDVALFVFCFAFKIIH